MVEEDSQGVNVQVRETVIDIFVKNLMHMDGGIPRGWSWRFVDERGKLSREKRLWEDYCRSADSAGCLHSDSRAV